MSDCRPDRFKYWYWENGERKKSRRDGYERRRGKEALLPDRLSYAYYSMSTCKMTIATNTRREERRKHKHDE